MCYELIRRISLTLIKGILMRNLLLATAASAAFSLPLTVSAQTAPAAAPASPHTFTANAALVSDYRFRGISQTYKAPAVQAGFDYSHASGLYLGTWASNVSSNLYTNGNLEWDFYGGYKFEPVKDLGIDLGTLYYYYPEARSAVRPAAPLASQNVKYNNWEIYAAASYSYFSGKVSYSLTDYFGLNTAQAFGNTNAPANNAPFGYCGFNNSNPAVASNSNCYGSRPGGSKGSTYTDLAFAYPFGDKWTFGAHYGLTKVAHWSQHSYDDWKISLNKEYNGFVFGLAYISTNAKNEWYTAVTPGFGVPVPAGEGSKKLGDSTVVLSVSKTF
jgi:uncharacterized protein (TIGR02001 family)